MTLLDRHLGRRFTGALLKIMLSLVLLFVVVDLLTHRQDNILRYGVPLRVVALYYLTFVPTILFTYHAAAISVLVAGLMVFGRAAQDNEITAALSGGISLRRFARTPILAALLVAMTAFAIQETLAPRAATTATDIESRYFVTFIQDDHRGVSWTNLGEGWTCHILRFNRRALTGEHVIIQYISPELEVDIMADRIYWDPERAEWMLENGRRLDFRPLRGMEFTPIRITQAPAPFNEHPDMLFALDQPPETKSSAELARDLHRAEALGMRTGRHWVSYHVKFAQPALCFIMIFLALPFAMRVRRGGLAVGFGLSIVIGLAYVMLYYASLGLGYLEVLSPILAAWLANAVFLAAGLILFARTPS